jgi:hypothetical protein
MNRVTPAAQIAGWAVPTTIRRESPGRVGGQSPPYGWFALALSFLALGCATGRDQTITGLPSAHAVRSGQLVVISDRPMAEDDPVIRELEQINTQVHETCRLTPGEREVIVYLFSDRDRYGKYMQKTHPNLPARRAFFIGTPKELAVYAFCGDQMMVDLRHEYTHGLLHAAIGHVPLWVDEGLAEYFEVGSRLPGGVNGEHLPPLATAIANGWQPNLQRLEQLEEVHEMHREDYQEAWAWVHFLLHQAPRGRETLTEYLADLRYSREAEPLSSRLHSTLPQADQALGQYVSRLGGTERVVRVSHAQ